MRTAYVTLTDLDCFTCGIAFSVPQDWNEKRIEDRTCGIAFSVPQDWNEKRIEDRTWWYCPNGHPQRYTGTTEAERLREQLETERRNAKFWRDRNDTAERRIAAQKGQATKLRKRIANGVCPCCKRHFADLHRHMHGQHPEYVTSEASEATV